MLVSVLPELVVTSIFDEVCGVRLAHVVRDEDGGSEHVVHRAVVSAAVRVARVFRRRNFETGVSLRVISDQHSRHEHGRHAVLALGVVVRVLCIQGEVTATTIDRSYSVT